METSQQMTERHWRERQELEAAERATAREAMQREREERAAAETAARLRDHEAKLANEVAATNPATMLNAIRSAGVLLSVDNGGTITALPAGRLTHVQRQVIQQKKDQVVGLLRAAQQAETL